MQQSVWFVYQEMKKKKKYCPECRKSYSFSEGDTKNLVKLKQHNKTKNWKQRPLVDEDDYKKKRRCIVIEEQSITEANGATNITDQ